jgi:hypothetical protein
MLAQRLLQLHKKADYAHLTQVQGLLGKVAGRKEWYCKATEEKGLRGLLKPALALQHRHR